MDLHINKIGAAKFDYEFMGKSAEQVAEIYGFPVQLVRNEIEEAGWERKLLPAILPDTRDAHKFAEALETDTRARLAIVSLFRQIEQQPLMAEIEKALLEKTLTMIQNLDIKDARVSAKLSAIMATVSGIKDRNPINLADQVKEAGDKKPGFTIQIANYANGEKHIN